MFKSIIVEGIDQLGKSTLIDGILNKTGFHQSIHYQSPKILDIYSQTNQKSAAAKLYQTASFNNMFHMLSGNGKYILDRAHLGEYVYAPRYREYDGSYVFDLEKKFINDLGSDFHKSTLLILLHASNLDFIKDDGLSLDFSKKEEEQMDFKRAFERSSIVNKLMVDVSTESGYVPKEAILKSVLRAHDQLPIMNQHIWHLSWELNHETGLLEQQNRLLDDPNLAIA